MLVSAVACQLERDITTFFERTVHPACISSGLHNLSSCQFIYAFAMRNTDHNVSQITKRSCLFPLYCQTV